jgi:fimbrial chaperone protein
MFHCAKGSLWHSGLFLFSLLCIAHSAQATKKQLQGTYFESTRVIYPEGARQGKSIVLNNNSNQDFLLQAYISAPDEKTGMPDKPSRDFLVTPPLMNIGARETRTLRLLRTGGEYPSDRESVFFLTARLIPGQTEKKEPQAGASAVFLTALAVKVFWRPKALDKPNAVMTAAGKLTPTIVGNTLTMSNPTPYYITLRTLSVAGADLPATELVYMVPPFGHHDYTIPAGIKRTSFMPVTWTAIKESGFDTDPFFSPVAVGAPLNSNNK